MIESSLYNQTINWYNNLIKDYKAALNEDKDFRFLYEDLFEINSDWLWIFLNIEPTLKQRGILEDCVKSGLSFEEFKLKII